VNREVQNNVAMIDTKTASSPRLPKRLYSIAEAAVYLGRTARAVREMLWGGKMPYIKDGKRILVDIRDMDIWIDRSKTQNAY
jgi:excisionase family DNA binding protein